MHEIYIKYHNQCPAGAHQGGHPDGPWPPNGVWLAPGDFWMPGRSIPCLPHACFHWLVRPRLWVPKWGPHIVVVRCTAVPGHTSGPECIVGEVTTTLMIT